MKFVRWSQQEKRETAKKAGRFSTVPAFPLLEKGKQKHANFEGCRITVLVSLAMTVRNFAKGKAFAKCRNLSLKRLAHNLNPYPELRQ